MRRRVELQYSHGTLSQFADAMTSWMRGTRLDQAKFASLFFGRSADDPVAQALHAAALAGALAQNHTDMRQASENVAKAIALVGVDQWSRFVVDAEARAKNPTTAAAVQSSQKIDTSRSDAIKPVYPLETLMAIGTAGGMRAVVRGGIGVAVKQMLPDAPAAKPRGSASSIDAGAQAQKTDASSPGLNEGQQGKHILGSRNFIPGRSTLTADPHTLLRDFAGKGRQIGRITVGKPGSKEIFDADQTIGTFRTQEGRSAQTTRGIIHYSKRGAHIVPSAPRNWKP